VQWGTYKGVEKTGDNEKRRESGSFSHETGMPLRCRLDAEIVPQVQEISLS